MPLTSAFSVRASSNMSRTELTGPNPRLNIADIADVKSERVIENPVLLMELDCLFILMSMLDLFTVIICRTPGSNFE